MIGDKERGSAWTQAFLGLKAQTIHVCGDERALNLINRLCKITGDEVQSCFFDETIMLLRLRKRFTIDSVVWTLRMVSLSFAPICEKATA